MKILKSQKINGNHFGHISDVFTDQELKFIDDYIEDELIIDDLGYSNRPIWQEGLTKDIEGQIKISRVHPLLHEELFNLILEKSKVVLNVELSPCQIGVIYYCGEDKSGINWHDDGYWKGAISYYLTGNWSKDYGGIFCYKDEDDVSHEILPERNSLVYQTGGVAHKVTPVKDNSPRRKSIQVFVRDR